MFEQWMAQQNQPIPQVQIDHTQSSSIVPKVPGMGHPPTMNSNSVQVSKQELLEPEDLEEESVAPPP